MKEINYPQNEQNNPIGLVQKAKPAAIAYMYAFLSGLVVPILAGLLFYGLCIGIFYLIEDFTFDDSFGTVLLIVVPLLSYVLPAIAIILFIIYFCKYLTHRYTVNKGLLLMILIITCVVSAFFWRNANPFEYDINRIIVNNEEKSTQTFKATSKWAIGYEYSFDYQKNNRVETAPNIELQAFNLVDDKGKAVMGIDIRPVGMENETDIIYRDSSITYGENQFTIKELYRENKLIGRYYSYGRLGFRQLNFDTNSDAIIKDVLASLIATQKQAEADLAPGEVIVDFIDTADETRVREMISRWGLQWKAGYPIFSTDPTYIHKWGVVITKTGEENAWITTLEKEPLVKSATRNGIIRAHE